MSAIKVGLERDGLGDLVLQVKPGDAAMTANVSRTTSRRAAFKSTDIYLPKVLKIDSGNARELDYESDVLSSIHWRGFDPISIADAIPHNANIVEAQLQRIFLSGADDKPIAAEAVSVSAEALRFDPAYAVRMISDIVQNPFVGREIVGGLIKRLSARGFDSAKIGKLTSTIIEELRRRLIAERDSRAEILFRAEVVAGSIQFRLRLDDRNWRMPFTVETTQPLNARQLVNPTGGPLAKSLFAPVYEDDFNRDERGVAVHLDSDAALKWWHRNVARTQYGIQGWQRHKIYPDFIFAVERGDNSTRITVLETKGDQLDNLDTDYKRRVLDLMTNSFAWDTSLPAGQLALVKNTGETVTCQLILMSDVPTKMPDHLGP